MRWIGRWLGVGLLVVLLVPSLAAWPSAVLDRGPAGAVRVSAFPLALTLLDPFVWTCARNSLLVASASTALAMGLGVGLGSIVGERRFRGRGSLWALMMVPLAAGPVLIAPSLEALLGDRGGWDWLASRSSFGVSAEAVVRWSALVWTGLVVGVPLVALATVAGLRRVDPAWIDAALAMGATRRRAWRDVAWPSLRPGVARASAMVFTLTLIEPAGPLVLGLGRTLAVQLVRAATRLDQPTRASTLALLATAIVLVGRALILRWGGLDHSRVDRTDLTTETSPGFRRAFLARLILTGWCALAVGPLGVWLWRVFRSVRVASVGPVAGWLAEPEGLTWLANSAMTAGLALTIDLLILRALSLRRPGPTGPALRLACRVFESVPPLALGASAVAVPWLMLALADFIEGPIAGGLRRIALELSPGRSPGVLLILVLAIGGLPMLAGVARRAQTSIRPSRVDAFRLIGESDRRASRAGGSGWLGVVGVGPAFLAFAMAATSLAPALLLTPYSERRTLAPALLRIFIEPGPVDPRAFGPVAVLLGLNLLALAIGPRCRVGSPET
jgi:ABC-type Fe3+ transport system permease subunit